MQRKDVRLPSSAPSHLLRRKHSSFLRKWDRDKDDYEYVMAEFLRLSGVYWLVTAAELAGDLEQYDKEEVRLNIYHILNSCFAHFKCI